MRKDTVADACMHIVCVITAILGDFDIFKRK